MVEIYADGADLKTIEILSADKRIRGFTTNPSLMKKAGVSDYRAFAKSILAITDKPVSFEVFADDFPGMERQAREIASWGNVFVKIPVTNSLGTFTGDVIKSLDCRVNVTAVMTLDQVMDSVQCVRNPESIVSVFAGRVADTGRDPMPLMAGAVDVSRGRAKILWASAREVCNVIQADACGVDIITLTPDLIDKLDGFGRDLEAYSLETVKQFKRDAEGLTL